MLYIEYNGGFRPGGFVQGDFVLGGFCPGGFCPGDFVRGGFVRGDFVLEPKRQPQKGQGISYVETIQGVAKEQ